MLLGFRGQTTVKNLGKAGATITILVKLLLILSTFLLNLAQTVVFYVHYTMNLIRGQTGFKEVWDNVKVTNPFLEKAICVL